MALGQIRDARKLIGYIQSNLDFELKRANTCHYNSHVAALFTDIVLQAGLNYKSIVQPRVERVLKLYPNTKTVSSFIELANQFGLEEILLWKNEVKLNRMSNLLKFCCDNNIDTAVELKEFLTKEEHKLMFLELKGFGNKTYDYLLKLLNVDTIAVDRHIYSFLEKAGIEAYNYNYSKSVVEYAADMLDISRRSIDYSIWFFMAYEERKISKQAYLELEF